MLAFGDFTGDAQDSTDQATSSMIRAALFDDSLFRGVESCLSPVQWSAYNPVANSGNADSRDHKDFNQDECQSHQKQNHFEPT